MTLASSPVVVETTGAVATITLNRPERLNAVSLPLYDELTDALDAIETDATVHAVILTGAGRAFCAGADLKEHGAGNTAGSRGAYVEVGQRVHRRLQLLSKPIVAAVNGAAVGAGLELALACDLVIVAEDAKLRFPELAFGTFVGGGTTYTLVQRIGLTRAKELIMLAEFFSGREAAEMGLANRAVPADRVLEADVGKASAGQSAPRRFGNRVVARSRRAARLSGVSRLGGGSACLQRKAATAVHRGLVSPIVSLTGQPGGWT